MKSKLHALILSLFLLITFSSQSIYAQDSLVTITTVQLKQANIIFSERDYYYTLNNLNKDIISEQKKIISLDSLAICKLDSCSKEDQLKIQKLTDQSNYNKRVAIRRGWIVGGFSILYLCLLLVN